MSIHNSVFIALMRILESKQPISASELIEAMEAEGFKSVEARRAVQLAFERGQARIDRNMRIVISERQLEAA